MQKMAEVAPQHYNFLLKTAEEIKTSPFKEEIIAEFDGLLKTAASYPRAGLGRVVDKGLHAAGNLMGSAPVRGLAGVGAAVGAAAVGGIAMALAGDMYEAAKRGLTKTRNYKAMMAANPNLRELPAKDVQKAFSVLHRFNPEFSNEPTVAGAWVKRQAMFGEDGFANVQELKGLIDTRKGVADAKRLPNVPDIKGLGGGRKGGKEGKEKDGPAPGGGGGNEQQLQAILQHLQSQDADAQDMFNNQQRFFQAPGGGQRTIPNK